MKIINILPYSSLITGRDFKVNLFGDGFHIRAAQQIWKRTQKYQLECWRPERKLKETISGEKDGIVYRAFPSFRPTLGFLDKYVWRGATATFPSIRFALWREYSLPMLRALKEECKGGDVLLHIYGFSDLSYLICKSVQDVPIVGSHGGGAPHTYSALSFLYHLPLSFIERSALKNVDKVLVSGKWIYNSFAKLHHDIILCHSFGVDFEQFKPIAKEKARDALGLPLNKKVLLHIGRFDVTKGLDMILKAYQELKSKYDLELLLVGGLKTDPLYYEAVKSGAIVREWVSQPELIPYYCAADVYLFPKFYSRRDVENLEEFMGIGTAPLESMACGTPVVGTNLKHFLGDENELKGVGKIPKCPSDVAQCIVEILEHPELYQNCRQIAQKSYSWDSIVAQTVGIYNELFDKYYGK